MVYLNTSSWDKTKAKRAVTADIAITGKDFGDDMPTLFVIVKNKKGRKQYVSAWPKFGTWGIGLWFETHDRCDTCNLPYQSTADEIVDHVRANDVRKIERSELVAAINALQQAIPWVCGEYGMAMPHDPRAETLARHPGLAETMAR